MLAHGQNQITARTESGTSWRSNTTRASMCQYKACCSPLCSSHIRPSCGHGILPLQSRAKFSQSDTALKRAIIIVQSESQSHHRRDKLRRDHRRHETKKKKKRGPVDEVGDEVGEALVVGDDLPQGVDVGGHGHGPDHPPLPPRHHVHVAPNAVRRAGPGLLRARAAAAAAAVVVVGGAPVVPGGGGSRGGDG